MLKLMKYEFLRRKRLLISILLIIVFLEAATYLGIHLGGNWNIMSVAFMMIICIGGLLFPFVDAVTNYYSDFKNKNGYMLFLTPNSGHKIVGSKALFALSELVVMVLLLVGVFALNFGLVQNLFPNVVNPIVTEMTTELQMVFNIQRFTLWTASPIILLVTLQYFTNIMLAILAITIAKTLLSNKDFNWLFALLFYFGLSVAMQLVNTGVLVLFGFAGDIIEIVTTNSNVLPNIVKYLIIASGMYIVWIAVSHYLSGLLLNRRTDL